MSLKEEIWQLAHQSLGADNLFIVDIEISGGGGAKKIKVLIDGDEGISIDDCVGVSRKMEKVLEEKEMIDTAYTLEVSSPGVDQPLKLKRQYVKNIGRRLSVMVAGDKITTGKLEEVTEEGIVIHAEIKQKNKKALEIKPVEIPFAEIKKSSVLVSFK